jgi:hypothetical protein
VTALTNAHVSAVARYQWQFCAWVSNINDNAVFYPALMTALTMYQRFQWQCCAVVSTAVAMSLLINPLFKNLFTNRPYFSIFWKNYCFTSTLILTLSVRSVVLKLCQHPCFCPNKKILLQCYTKIAKLYC